jgi:hypothetical protein
MSILIRFAGDRGTPTDGAVDDKSFLGEELLADPEQIFCCLFVDGNARPNASVDKQKIAAADPRYVLAATERGRRSGSPGIRGADPRIIPSMCLSLAFDEPPQPVDVQTSQAT